MNISAVNDYIYDIAWFMSFGDGKTKDEIEYVISWAAFQPTGSVPYNRDFGGGFGNLEQQSAQIDQKITEFQVNLVRSIYEINKNRNFDPYIVLGGDYIIAKQDGAKLNVLVLWVLQKDIRLMGVTQISDNR